MKRKNKGPSCFGSILLLAAVVLILKIAYNHVPQEESVVSDTRDALTAVENAEEEPLYDVLLRELTAYSSEITFDYDCTSELFDTFERVCDDHPELFWVNGSGSSEKRTVGNEVTVTLRPEPVLTLVEILGYKEKLDQRVQEILDGMNPAMSDYDKILYVHDVLIQNTEYDSACAEAIGADTEYAQIWQSSSAYGCLVEGRAVCSGYAAAFQLLMNETGIPCIRVDGSERDSGVLHEWNCVKLNEKWYYVDVTWDDPVFEDGNSLFKGMITYDYFLISEEMLMQTHVIGTDEMVPACTDMSQSYYARKGHFLENYSYSEAASIIASQLGNDYIELQFANTAEAEEACADLFDGQSIYEIPGMQGASVTYSIGRNGLLRIAVM